MSESPKDSRGWPRYIYLQTEDDMRLAPPTFWDTTWCADRINATDIVYVRAGTKMAELVAAYEEQKRLVDDLYDVIATIEMALFMPGEGQPDLETAHRLIVAAGPSKGEQWQPE